MLNVLSACSAISALNTMELTEHTFVLPEWVGFLIALGAIIAAFRIPVVLLGLYERDGDN